jgi:two-component system CheB/CheR fusion protein
VLEWREIGGPQVAPPDFAGFGLSLLDGEIQYRHGGTVDTRFEPDGLVVRITLPPPKVTP